MVNMTEEEKIQLVNDCFNNKMPAELKILYLWCELDWKQISKNRQHQAKRLKQKSL